MLTDQHKPFFSKRSIAYEVIIGIDLGTTFSATAVVRDGVPHIVPQGDERIMPSVVGFTPQGALLVGTPARNQYVLHPDRTVRM